MSHIKSYFVSGAKFNRPCGLGFAAADTLSPNDANTLGLVISESMCFMYEPRLLDLGYALNIPDSDKLTMGDLGCLVHAEASEEKGTRIALALPEWTQPFAKGVDFSFKLTLGQAMRAFLKDIAPTAKWIFPITVNDSAFVAEVEEFLGIPMLYSLAWMLPDGIAKLRHYAFECEHMSEADKIHHADDIAFLNNLLKEAVARQDPLSDYSDEKDLVTTIGGQRRKNLSSLQID